MPNITTNPRHPPSKSNALKKERNKENIIIIYIIIWINISPVFLKQKIPNSGNDDLPQKDLLSSNNLTVKIDNN